MKSLGKNLQMLKSINATPELALTQSYLMQLWTISNHDAIFMFTSGL